MAFRSGPPQRNHKTFKAFAPSDAHPRIEEVPLEELKAQGKRLILLDVDNTLVAWRGYDIAPEVRDWLKKAKDLGFDLCILSNTRRLDRLAKLSSDLGVETVRDRFKPSRKMYHAALSKFGATKEQAVMIGDQLLTDILGANRSGIDAIFVEKLSSHEFIGTKINRKIEGVILKRLYYRNDESIEQETTVTSQLMRFAIIGASSFVIDYLGLRFLMFTVHFGGHPLGDALGGWLRTSYPNFFQWAVNNFKAATPLLSIPGTSLAICNSFYWNRKWTFGIAEQEGRGQQFGKFLILSFSGMAINALITSTFNNIIPGHEQRSLLAAKVIATGAVAVWNFTGQRFWAFKGASD